MDINYIILAHKNPQQIKRLAERLNNIGCNFYIHIEKSIEMAPFIKELAHIDNVFFLSDEKRQHGVWGDIGLVKATLNALEQILNDNRKGFCILLSGQDYPIKNQSFINSYLKENANTNFITTFSLPYTGWFDGGMPRLSRYKINRSANRGDFVFLPSITQRDFYRKDIVRNVLSLLKRGRFDIIPKILKKRTHPDFLKPYGGDQWWTLPINTIKLVVDFLNTHKDYLLYHEDSFVPDELFFQSIIMHLQEKHQLIIRPSVTYVNWTRPNTPLPVTFVTGDLEELKTQPDNMLFARKFDLALDSHILDLLDRS